MHALGAACVDKFADDVALAVLPKTVSHTMFGVFAGPQTEAVVVLRREDDRRDTEVLGDLDGWAQGRIWTNPIETLALGPQKFWTIII